MNFFKGRISAKIFFFLVLTDLIETGIQFCFKKSAISAQGTAITGIREGLDFIVSVTRSPYLWIALVSVFILFVIWSVILSKVDLSVAVPVASFSYICVPLASTLFLGEKITLLRWCGIAFILIGVILVSASTRQERRVS